MEKKSFDNESEDEYNDYKKTLMMKKECAACHYIHGLFFLGVGVFTFFRMNFIRQTLNYKQILLYSGVILISSAITLYKFSYAYHIYQIQTKWRETFKKNK